MRNFTREGAAVSGRHTQGSDYPYPQHSFGGRQAGAAAHHHGGAGRGYPAGGLPGHSQRGRLPRWGRRIPGAAGYPAGGYVRGATGRTWRGGYRGGRIYPAAGYRGKRGGCSPNVGGYRARGYLRWSGRATCAGAYTGQGYTWSAATPAGGGRRRGGTAAPSGAAIPAGYRGGKLAIREGGL